MRATLVGIAVGLLWLAVQENLLKREVLGGQPPAAPDKDLDPPLPPGPREAITGFQREIDGKNRRLFDCSVTEVAANSITVFYKGSSGWTTDVMTGEKLEWVSIPARQVRFSVSKDFTNGEFGKRCVGFGRDASYPLTAVKVGDRVTLEINDVDGRYVCTGIRIERRPNGRVPKAPLDGLPESAGHHYEGANALQDLEEKGIPLPLKYEYLKNNGTLPEHLRGKMAFPGIIPSTMSAVVPSLNCVRHLFR